MGRVGGKLTVAVNGVRLSAKGEFEWNDGSDKREMIVGPDGVHGYKEMPQVPFIRGAATITPDFDPVEAKAARDATVSLELASGHMCVLRSAVYSAEGTAKTEEGEMEVEYQGLSMEITKP